MHLLVRNLEITRIRLRESKEYAFYKEVFCRIPEDIFADLYAGSAATRPNTRIRSAIGIVRGRNYTMSPS